MLRTTIALIGCVLLSPALAAEGEDNCTGTIASLPVTISTPGTWCLSQHLATYVTSGAAITIDANDVTIDCNDFKVGGLPSNVNTNAVGILAASQLNVTIRNCSVRGFREGIRLEGTSSGGLIERNRLDLNRVAAIRVAGSGHEISHNQIVETGGRPASVRTDGIVSTADMSRITDNSILGVNVAGSDGDVVGIAASGNANEIVRNTVSGLLPDGAGEAVAIETGAGNGSSLHRNQLFAVPTTTGTAILSGADNQCSHNNYTGWSTGIVACVDGGGNFGN